MEPRLRVVAVVAAALLAGACQTTSNCAGWTPIYPSRSDSMTEGTQRMILAHNRQGVAAGCWRSPR